MASGAGVEQAARVLSNRRRRLATGTGVEQATQADGACGARRSLCGRPDAATATGPARGGLGGGAPGGRVRSGAQRWPPSRRVRSAWARAVAGNRRTRVGESSGVGVGGAECNLLGLRRMHD
eukprot:354499-Chlamydomonas_euryale.AAC.2